MDSNTENRRTSSNDKRFHNVNYVRHVLRRFFNVYHKKSSTSTPFDDVSSQESQITNILKINSTSVIIDPCLQYDKHTKFSGKHSNNFLKLKQI